MQLGLQAHANPSWYQKDLQRLSGTSQKVSDGPHPDSLAGPSHTTSWAITPRRSPTSALPWSWIRPTPRPSSIEGRATTRWGDTSWRQRTSHAHWRWMPRQTRQTARSRRAWLGQRCALPTRRCRLVMPGGSETAPGNPVCSLCQMSWCHLLRTTAHQWLKEGLEWRRLPLREGR
jgi:hypothetical protein